jgi:hypothetical protein
MLGMTLLSGCAQTDRRPGSSTRPGLSWFDRANRSARANDTATTSSQNPAWWDSDPFIGSGKRSPSKQKLADNDASGAKRTPRLPEPRLPKPDDDEPITLPAGDEAPEEKSPERRSPESKTKSAVEDAAHEQLDAEPVSNATAEYRKLRQRLEKLKARWSSDNLGDSKEFVVHCEVPDPTDPELWEAFEARHENELKALQAVTLAAEQWLAAKRKRRPTQPETDS